MNKLTASRFSDLEEACAHYLDMVDSLVTERRYVAPDKAEARRLKLADAVAGSGAWVEAEAAALGVPVAEVCQMVLDKKAMKDSESAKLEAARIQCRNEVRSCSTIKGMYAAVEQLRRQL